MFIPQPNPLPVCEDSRSLNPLRSSMIQTHTEGQFHGFITIAREVYAELGFPKGKTPEQVDTDIWEAWVNKVAQKHRAIKSYENYWPLVVYANFLANKYRARQNRNKPRRARPQRHRLPENSSHKKQKRPALAMTIDKTDLPPSQFPRRTRYFVGKPPPGVTGTIRYATLLELKALNLPRALSVTTECSVDETCAEVNEEGPGLHRLKVSTTPLPRTIPSSSPSSTLNTLSAKVERQEEDPGALAIPCPKCPWMPEVPSSRTTRLQAFLDNSGHVSNLDHLLALRSAGVSTDAHFKLLLEWGEEDRRVFFQLIDPAEITPWDKMQMLKRLSGIAATSTAGVATVEPREASGPSGPSYIVGSRRSQGRGTGGLQRSWSVWQPGRVDEELLTDPSKPLALLEQAMEIGNHNLFQDILNHIQNLAEPYLSTYFPSPAQLEETISLIAGDKVLYELYEHYWPIRFYIKRLVRKLGNKPLDWNGKVLKDGLDCQDIPEESRWNSRASSSTIQPSSPNLRSTCPTHPLIDTRNVAQPIQAYLHYRGLPEFIPALALVGITTSEQFLEFCRLDEAEREGLFGDPRVLCVTLFHKVCLKVEFSEAKVEVEGFKTRFLP